MCYPHWIKLLPTYLPTYHRHRRKFDHKFSDWSVKRSATVFHRSSFYRCKHRIHQRVHIQIFHGNVKIVQNERKRRTVIDSDEEDWLWIYFLSTLSSFELIFTTSKLDFHLTLTWSIFCDRKNIVWWPKNPYSNLRINNCFCQIPLQSVFRRFHIQ